MGTPTPVDGRLFAAMEPLQGLSVQKKYPSTGRDMLATPLRPLASLFVLEIHANAASPDEYLEPGCRLPARAFKLHSNDPTCAPYLYHCRLTRVVDPLRVPTFSCLRVTPSTTNPDLTPFPSLASCSLHLVLSSFNIHTRVDLFHSPGQSKLFGYSGFFFFILFFSHETKGPFVFLFPHKLKKRPSASLSAHHTPYYGTHNHTKHLPVR